MTDYKLGAIRFGNIPSGSMFKIGFFCNIFIWGVLGLIFGGLAMLGYNTVSWNHQHVYGLAGLLFGVGICVVFAFLGAVLLMVGGLLATWAARRFGFGELYYLVPVTEPVTDAAENDAGGA
ncbi:hypothetical protein [Kordiimonas marina]|uniref:hypothetical protein n=1 Tax=Kordiimonas marina TaxID=2872312 RepID=UPI001FF14F4D|nr:hypothetical protein [Kordiimonas marina]MCJ9429158.1 hypothetical protein [Kordiimonas marina]